MTDREMLEKCLQNDDYCDCDHTPRCPHCGKKLWRMPAPQPYPPAYYPIWYVDYTQPQVTY
jgi:hypothetical protein